MKSPLEFLKIEKIYKKQVPDLKASGKPNHLEMEENLPSNSILNVKNGTLHDISGKNDYFVGAGKMANRQNKVKEIMKSQKLSMIEASSYIKKNKIPY